MVYVRFKKCFFPWDQQRVHATRNSVSPMRVECWMVAKCKNWILPSKVPKYREKNPPPRPSMNLAILMVTILGMKPIIFRFSMCKWCMYIQIWFHIFYVHVKFWKCWNGSFRCSNYPPAWFHPPRLSGKRHPICSGASPRPLVWRHGPRRYAAGAVARSQSCKFLGSVVPNPWAMGRLVDWLPIP